MSTQIAIIASAAIIAISIAFVGRWEIASGTAGTYRLDHWTGSVTRCVFDTTTFHQMKCDGQ